MLAIESATIEVGVALAGPGGLLAALVARPGRRHVETLHPAIVAVCSAASTPLASVGAVCVDVGPGLFTGIRVGVAAAKGVAFGLGVPVVTCTSIEVLAEAAQDVALTVVPVVDMRRGEVAWAVPGQDMRIGSTADLAADLAGLAREAMLVGDGALRHRVAIVEATVALGGAAPRIASEDLGAPGVAALARLGIRRLAAGVTTDAARAEPCYLRPPDARANWVSRPAPVVDVGARVDPTAVPWR